MALITLQPGEAKVTSERKTALAAPLSGITIDGRLDDWPGGLPVYKIREMAATYGPTDVDGADLDNSTDLSPEFSGRIQSERAGHLRGHPGQG